MSATRAAICGASTSATPIRLTGRWPSSPRSPTGRRAPGAASSCSRPTWSARAATTNFGWYLTLAAGEKQVGGTLASGSGAVQFGTNQPSASAGGGACSPNLGVARQYSVNFADGTAFSGTSVSTTYAGGGFLPS